MKIVVNRCYGGFGLSLKAVIEYAKRKNIKLYAYIDDTKDYNKYIRINEEVDDQNYFCVHYYTKEINNEKDLEEDDIYFSERDIERNDPVLIAIVEEMGEKANGSCANLQVVDIPNDVEWYIDDYDGHETIREKHRSW